MIRTALTLMLCLASLFALACDEAEPAADAGQPADAVLESVQQDIIDAEPTERAVEDLRTTQPVVAPPRSGPEDPFGPAPAPPADETTATGRERDPEQLRTTQPVQRPVQSPESP